MLKAAKEFCSHPNDEKKQMIYKIITYPKAIRVLRSKDKQEN